MGALANALRGLIPQFWRSNGAGGLTSAQDARTYQEHVADAVEQLEAQATASRWFQGSGPPAPALGQVYDQYLDNDTGDTWDYVAGQGWQRTGNLHGKDGKTPVKGVDYFDGRTPVKGVDYFDGKDGKTPVKGTDYFDGHTPVKGVEYFDGRDGSQLYQGSAAPTAADPGKVGDKFYHFLSSTEYAVYDYPAVVAAGQNPWRLRFTTPAGGSSGGGTTAGVTSFNTRTGAVNLSGADVNGVLTAGDNITLSLVSGKLVIAGAPATSAGHTIKDASGTTITRPTIVVRSGLRIVDDATNNQMAFELDPAGQPASEGNQAGLILDFAKRYQNRAAGAGNITLSDFQSIGVGGKCRVELNSTSAADQLLFGGYTVTGADASFQSTVKISATASSGMNQVVTFYDRGGPFIGGVKNVVRFECIGTNRFDFTIDPDV